MANRTARKYREDRDRNLDRAQRAEAALEAALLRERASQEAHRLDVEHYEERLEKQREEIARLAAGSSAVPLDEMPVIGADYNPEPEVE